MYRISCRKRIIIIGINKYDRSSDRKGIIIMLAAGVMNGLIIWILNIIKWVRRVWYAVRGAVVVPGVCEKADTAGGKSDFVSETYRITYEGCERTVRVFGQSREFAMLLSARPAELLWIPGKKTAMLPGYKCDDRSRKSLLFCDAASLAGLAALIGGFVRTGITAYSRVSALSTEICVLGGIALMTITSLIRRKLR